MSRPVLVGVDVGGTKILGVAVEPSGEVEIRGEVRRATPQGAEAVISAVVEVVCEVGGDDVVSIGVGVPGLVDRTGRLAFGPNLSQLADVPFGAELSARLGRPVVVDNDATCAAWAESTAGAGRSVDNLLLVALGTGIGAGIVRAGALHHGEHGFAGEPGHMVIDPSGPRCPCGRRGCWERMASGSGLGRLGRDAAAAGEVPGVLERAGGDPEAVRAEHVVAAARAGDADAGAVLDEFGWWVALGLANLVNHDDPGLIVLGGGVMESADVLLDRIRRPLPELVLGGGHRPVVPIEVARFGERAGAVGAALLARDEPA